MAKVEKSSKKIEPSEKEVNLHEARRGMSDMAKSILSKHVEVANNARGYFRNENGTTIVEDRVPRGDADQMSVIMPRNQDDLTEKDIKALAVEALSMIDPTLAKYDRGVAEDDALHMAIATKDGGKYAGKVGANTYALIKESMGRAKKAAENPPVVKMSTPKATKLATSTVAKSTITKPTEVQAMDKAAVQKQIDEMKTKMAALEAMVAEPVKAPEAVKAPVEVAKTPVQEILASIDEVAGLLENEGSPELMKIAYELDKVSDRLEGKPIAKKAKVMKQDADEGFMKGHFEGGVKEKDADEKFMGAFNTDLSTEVLKLRKGLTNLPYQIKG